MGFLYFLVFLCFYGNSFAFAEMANAHTYPSLFFDDEEIARLHESNQATCGTLSLSAILYYDENHWCLWINDKVIRPENVEELMEFRIEKVSPDEVEFSQRSAEGEISETFILRPHQRRP